MNRPDNPNWETGEGIGSAKYFGECLGLIRDYNKQGYAYQAELAGMDPERYLRLEHGEEPEKPFVAEFNQWARGWNLTRDEIIDLKMAGGYDIEPYLGRLDGETMARGLAALIEENRRTSSFQKARMYFEVGRALIGIFVDEHRSGKDPR